MGQPPERRRRPSPAPPTSLPATRNEGRGGPSPLPPGGGLPEFSTADLGRRIREARKAAGLTLVKVAAASGYSITHLCQIERGRACPTIPCLRAIARAIGRDVGVFLEVETLPDASEVRRAERVTTDMAPPHMEVELLTRGVPGGRLQTALQDRRLCAPESRAR